MESTKLLRIEAQVNMSYITHAYMTLLLIKEYYEFSTSYAGIRKPTLLKILLSLD